MTLPWSRCLETLRVSKSRVSRRPSGSSWRAFSETVSRSSRCPDDMPRIVL